MCLFGPDSELFRAIQDGRILCSGLLSIVQTVEPDRTIRWQSMKLTSIHAPMIDLLRRSMIDEVPVWRMLRRSTIAGALVWGMFLSGSGGGIRAQTIGQRLLMHTKNNVSISGSVGFAGEAYSTSGRGRRPPFSGRSFMQATVNVLGIKTGLNLLYSTEDSRVRQSLNRIGFESSWRWVKVGIGDTHPRFSEFSLNGLQLRGGIVELSPGILRLGFATGSTQRATEGQRESTVLDSPTQTGSYRRNVTAVRIGLGDETGSYFHLIGMKARDDTLSIRTPTAARPEENLSLTSLTGIRLFNRRFNLEIEGTISAHNRDLFARKIDTDDLLDADSTDLPTAVLPLARLITDLFTPTISTSVGYAVQARTTLRVKNVKVSAQYKRIGPGFTSLGVFTVRNDVEEWRVRPIFRFMRDKVSVAMNYGQSRNNLSNERASSRRRNQVGVNVRTQWTQGFSVASSFQQGISKIEPEIDNPALQRKHVTQNVTFNPTLILKRGIRTHTFSLSTTFQRLYDSSTSTGTETQSTADFRNLSANLSWFGNVADHLNLNATVNLLQNRSTSNTSVWGLNAGASGDLLDRKVNLGLILGVTRTTRSSRVATLNTEISLLQLTANMTAGYRITKADQLRLSVRGLRSQNSENGAPSFNEIRGQVNFSHSF